MSSGFPPDPQSDTIERVALLRDVPKEEFDKVWAIVTECGEAERHFNGLQSIYRGLASTWLLAMFAAVGFLLKENVGNKWSLICGAGLAVSVGILLLWLLDVLVYHRLLLAHFYDARELERACRWLPPSRNRMKSRKIKNAVRRAVGLFYLGFIFAGTAVALCGATKWKGWGLGILLVVVIALFAAILWHKTLCMEVPSGGPTKP